MLLRISNEFSNSVLNHQKEALNAQILSMLPLPVQNIVKEYPQITHTQTEREPLPIPCVLQFFHPFKAINRTHLTSNIKVRIFSSFFLPLNTIYIIWFDLCIQRFILCNCMHTLFTRSDFTQSGVFMSDISWFNYRGGNMYIFINRWMNWKHLRSASLVNHITDVWVPSNNQNGIILHKS